MTNLAIKGHPTRGKEVIEILEMLGGINTYNVNHTEKNLLYCLREGDNVIIATYPNTSITNVFTLEGFFEKFPYKVGDKVSSKYLKNYKIAKMEWEDCNNRVIYKLQGMGWYNVKELEPYKEEKTIKTNVAEVCEKIVLTANKNELELIVADDSELVNEDGKWYVRRKKPNYPTTFEECCKILNIEYKDDVAYVVGYKRKSLTDFQKLLICRDAYWKIAGEEMGLGKPWEPDWKKQDKKYIISVFEDTVIYFENETSNHNTILAFPTQEIRDKFQDYFGNYIDNCSDFL